MRKGIILAGGSGTRLQPLTLATSKQLLPVYDKPMIYYSLSILMLAGIKDILIICNKDDLMAFKKLFYDSKRLGLNLSYEIQESPNGIAEALIIGEKFLDGNPCCLVLGDNFLFGQDIKNKLIEANSDHEKARIFGHYVADPTAYGVAIIKENRVVEILEKPKKLVSNYAIPGIYFLPRDAPKITLKLIPSERNELEITDLLRLYLQQNKLEISLLGRGTAWIDMGTHDKLLSAANYVSSVQKIQSFQVANIHEISLRQNWISREELLEMIQKKKTSYFTYLMDL